MRKKGWERRHPFGLKGDISLHTRLFNAFAKPKVDVRCKYHQLIMKVSDDYSLFVMNPNFYCENGCLY